ncbi:MAG: TetR/AcrR family transcriptional regulator [Spirochaetaceae bacterium]|nr:MAG: TetR/AcrR family transcriptional regulator [Spirochaetaceae bacterium]
MRGSTNKHQLRSDKTYRSIVDTAYRLYLENGIEATTIQQIAQEIGAHRATVYRYFGSQVEIGFAVAEQLNEELLGRYFGRLEVEIQEAGTAWEKLSIMIRVGNRVCREMPESMKFFALFDAYLDILPANAKLGMELDELLAETTLITWMTDVIEEGRKDGSIRSDIDSKLMAVALRQSFMTLWNRIVLWREGLSQAYGIANPEDLADVLLGATLDGIRARN